MKKMISKFADSLLSREDLKRVKGGYGDEFAGTCGTGCGCKKWPAVVGCHCTDQNWWGNSQGKSC